MKILLTNDDGVDSPGLLALVELLKERAELYVIAPASQRSGFGHAFSYKRPVYYSNIKLPNGHDAIAVEGTPVDCVKMGVYWSQKKFDWVISGMNSGDNVGVSTFYSGTIGGASEGTIQGIPSMAMSMQYLRDETKVNPMDVDTAARLCVNVFDQVLDKKIPDRFCLNVNVPSIAPDDIKGIAVAPQAHQRFVPQFESEPYDGDHHCVLFRTKVEIFPDDSPDVDYAKLEDGWITVTPLNIDRTETSQMETLNTWNWTL